MIKPIFIGIAGGSGAGKSTLCTALFDKYPDDIGMVQLDDYLKPAKDVPIYAGRENWDHPDSLYLYKLANDLRQLGRGEPAIINTKNDRLNPEYRQTERRKPVQFKPKKVMLVEGYLVLYDKRIRDMLTTSIWLDVDHETRWQRRVHFKDSEYEQKVILPMYKEFAEPTKQYAEHMIDVTGLPREKVFEKVESILDKYLNPET